MKKLAFWLFTYFACTSAFKPSSRHLNVFHKRILENNSPKSFTICQLFGNEADLSVALYDLQLLMSSTLSSEIMHPSIASFGVLYFAGVLTALSPCSLGMLPITLSYLGSSEKSDLPVRSLFYALGLALAFSALGLSAALAGQVFGVLQSESSVISSAIDFLRSSSKVLVSVVYLVCLILQ
jgi:thiol:disulfide interchange protein